MIKQSRLCLVTIVLLIAWCFTGCATLFNGKTQRIRVDSNIPGAVVKIDDTIVGQTPFIGDMPRSKKNRTVTVQARGFAPQQQSMLADKDNLKQLGGNSLLTLGAIGGTIPLWGTMSNVVPNSVIGGALICSLISITIDNNNGSAYQYYPSQLYFHFLDENWSKADEILLRKYAMLNHSQIAIDAKEENGEYLNALADMMSKKMTREEAITSIKVALEYSEGDQLAFGDEIVDSFRYHH